MAVLPFNLGSHDSLTVRRTDSLAVAIRAALAADTSVMWLPRDSAWIRQHRGGPLGPPAKYIVAGATLGLWDAPNHPDGRMRVDWYILDVGTGNPSPRDSLTILPGEDARAATTIAARVASVLHQRSQGRR